ncbi:alanine dehydrogenase [Streptomyces cinnamoneus]|nr:alanine dehydrogenase [Streptomyces cinnamoneus]
MHRPFRCIGLAAEHESPENPDGSETRVALTPAGVAALVAHGCAVGVERDAGSAVGFPDAAYRAAGAVIESRAEVYRDKDLVIKLKGPAHEDVRRMDPGSCLLCMAHVQSIPRRVAVANESKVNVIAMELIREIPETLPEAYLRSQLALRQIFSGLAGTPPDRLSVAFVGFSADAFGAVQYAARCGPRSLHQLSGRPAGRPAADVLFVDVDELAERAAHVPAALVREHLARHPLRPYGRRRIECLHETGRAGARFGIELALRANPRVRAPAGIAATVLGYGNVAFGALDECVRHGVTRVDVLTKRDTRRPRVSRLLQASDLVINGVEQPSRFRGTSYLVTEEDVRSVLRPGTVVVDLVGGCATNRTAVEPIVESTHPADPYFVRNGVFLSSVWGWPLMGFQRESVERYSRQIVRVLLTDEQLINGLAAAPAGIRRALVAGPMISRRTSSHPVALSATLRG